MRGIRSADQVAVRLTTLHGAEQHQIGLRKLDLATTLDPGQICAERRGQVHDQLGGAVIRLAFVRHRGAIRRLAYRATDDTNRLRSNRQHARWRKAQKASFTRGNANAVLLKLVSE